MHDSCFPSMHSGVVVFFFLIMFELERGRKKLGGGSIGSRRSTSLSHFFF